MQRGRILRDHDLVDRVARESVIERTGTTIGLAVERHALIVANTEVLLYFYRRKRSILVQEVQGQTKNRVATQIRRNQRIGIDTFLRQTSSTPVVITASADRMTHVGHRNRLDIQA